MNTIIDMCMVAMFLLVLLACYAVTVRDGRNRNLEIENDGLRASLAETIHLREEAWQLLHWRDEQNSPLIRENTLLLFEMQWLRSHADTGLELDAEGVIADVEEWLEGDAA
jgi:hypothetical protein